MKAAWVESIICSFLHTLEVWISLAHVHIFLWRWSPSSHNTSNTKNCILRPLPQDALLKFLIILLGSKYLNHYKEKEQEPVPRTAVAYKWPLSKRCRAGTGNSGIETCGWMALGAPGSKAQRLAVWATTFNPPFLSNHSIHLLSPHTSSACN